MNVTKLVIICGLTACLATNSNQDYTDFQIEQAVAMAQKAVNVYQQTAPEQEFPIMLEFLRYYRSWYQAVTPAPIRLVEQLSPAALKFIAQLKSIANRFTQTPQAGLMGASRLSAEGERFYQQVITMVQSQLIEGKQASIMVIPRIQARLF